MNKMRISPACRNLKIFGSAVGLLAMLQTGNALAQKVSPAAAYGTTPIYQSPTVQSLGTLRGNEADPTQSAYNPSNNPPATLDDAVQPMQAGDITYITGGIGDEERNYFHAVSENYNLHISNASRDGAFVGETHIVIRNNKGDVLLDADAGPLFFARLAPGSYAVEATHNGDVKKKAITVNRSGSKIHFSW